MFYLVPLLLVLIVIRIITNTTFSYVYTDLDQVMMWASAREFSHGRFHEPCFWGQDYSTMFEGLISAPLLLVGVPAALAVPTVASCLALLPFCLFAINSALKGSHAASALSLMIPIAMPARFHIITSLPRGFIPGCALASLGIFIFEVLLRRNSNKLASFVLGFCLALSVFVMPNAALLALPVSLYYFLSRKLCLSVIIGAAFSLLWPAYVYWFYKVAHPEYVLYPSVNMTSFTLGTLIESANKLDRFFLDLTPFGFNRFTDGALAFSGSLIICCFLLKSRVAATTCLASVILAFAVLANPKTLNASDSLFYSYSRFFLAWPYLWSFLLSQLHITPIRPRWVPSVAVLAISALCFFLFLNDLKLQMALEGAKSNPVAATEVISVMTRVSTIQKLVIETKINALVFYDLERIPALAALASDPNDSFQAFIYHDRRAWFLKQNLPLVFSKIAFIGFPENLTKQASQSGLALQSLGDYGLVLNNLNSQSMSEIFRQLSIPIPK